MALKKLALKPGLVKEATRYSAEGGWVDADKVRFRRGLPEVVGGWSRISTSTFVGVCRSLLNWVTLAGLNLCGVGTSRKFYVESGGVYSDVTPLRTTATLGTNPFTATDGSAVITVAHTAHGGSTGDYVTYSGATGLGGNITASVLNTEHTITVTSANAYTITVSATANATDAAAAGGGAAVSAAYQLSIGPDYQVPLSGWGVGTWGSGTWGVGSTSAASLRIWSQSNFGEDLIYAPRGGAIYYWDASAGFSTRGVALTSMGGASDVPTVQNLVFVSDLYRFVFAFGCNELGSGTQDALLVRWSDQESAVNWTPSATNQAGSLRLSHGSAIVAVTQTRQELLVFTDYSLYSMQYVGAPIVWGAQLLGDNISVINQNATATASGAVYWMGVDKFYVYDGRVQTLECDVRGFVFGDLEYSQQQQVFAGTVESFNEIWWFYPSSGSYTVDRYVVFNYAERVWYTGSMARTAWFDSSTRAYPLAATYSNNLVYHEYGVDDLETGSPQPISAYIESAEFDLDDGDRFGFVHRVLPDLTFDGSTAGSPQATLSLTPLINSGAGYTNPASEGGSSSATVTRTVATPVEQYTGQVYIRVRGRQMVLRVESAALGTRWKLGHPRIDVRPDGRR